MLSGAKPNEHAASRPVTPAIPAPDAAYDGPPVSAYVVCRDEAAQIGRCLRSLAWCAQIVVVDSGSTDGTLDIVRALAARGLPIELHERAWPGYAKQKQWALERCTGTWCLNLDGDEELAPDFAARLGPILRATGANGIRVMGRFELNGYGMPPAGVALSPLRRLSRNGHARFDTTTLVHEHLMIEGEVETERALVLLHRRPDPIDALVAKEARYGALKALQAHRRGRRPSVLKLLLNPTYVFLRHYIARRYALAGVAGYVAARRLAAYAFVTEARLFELARAGAARGGEGAEGGDPGAAPAPGRSAPDD